MFYILARKAIGYIGNKTRMRVTHRFEMVYHSECTKRLIIGIIRSLRVTPIACGLEAPKRHRKNTAFYPSASFLFSHP